MTPESLGGGALARRRAIQPDADRDRPILAARRHQDAARKVVCGKAGGQPGNPAAAARHAEQGRGELRRKDRLQRCPTRPRRRTPRRCGRSDPRCGPGWRAAASAAARRHRARRAGPANPRRRSARRKRRSPAGSAPSDGGGTGRTGSVPAASAPRTPASCRTPVARPPTSRASRRKSVIVRTSPGVPRANCMPAGVSRVPCAVRSNSGVPTQSSSARMRRLNAGCVTWRNSAAREKLPVSLSATKSISQASSICYA